MFLFEDGIFGSASRVFSDVEEDYCQVERVLAKFMEWKTGDEDAYRESYVPLCIPKLLSPIIRLQLIYCDPLQVFKQILIKSVFIWYSTRLLFCFFFS